MTRTTGIAWTERTWNLTRGCRRTSAKGAKQSGCGNDRAGGCYAERTAARFCGVGQPYHGLVKLTARGPRWTGDVRFVTAKLLEPMRWRAPAMVFVNSMSDLFYEGFSDDEIALAFAGMALAHWHTFQVLTKRAARARALLSSVAFYEKVLIAAARLRADMTPAKRLRSYPDNHKHPSGIDWPVRNVWIGVSAENQEAADERIPDLLDLPAVVRFVSVEPLLGAVLLWAFLKTPLRDQSLRHLGGRADVPGLDWVIVGAESGPRSRPAQVKWLRDLRDECQRAGVALFLKQAVIDVDEPGAIAAGVGSKRKARGLVDLPYLDGVQHAAFPER